MERANTKTTYHSAIISPYKLVTRRGIIDHPAQPLVTAPHFTVTSTSFGVSTTSSNSIVGLGYSLLKQPQFGCVHSVFSFPAPPHSSRLHPRFARACPALPILPVSSVVPVNLGHSRQIGVVRVQLATVHSF